MSLRPSLRLPLVNHTSRSVATLAFAMACAPIVAGSPALADPTPSPSATAAARPSSARPGSREIHRAIVTCDRAPFYVWPDRSSAPSVSGYPGARPFESFEVIGDGTLAYGGLTLYETTIDVFSPYGAGKHYWISAACVNAG